jgi:lipopolysaccharide cholinephosphotransferase
MAMQSKLEDFDVLFPDERETGETTLRQCQLVMLRMLKIFDYLCRKYDIKYFLTGGTLIGAVRHQGFIPWDDDLDVGMTREDYEKFLTHAVKDLPNDIFFQTQYTDKFYPRSKNVDARLRDKYSSYVQHHHKPKWHDGFQVDIFVYDKAFLPHNFFVVLTNRILKELNDNGKRAKILKFVSKYSPFSLVYCSNYMQRFGAMRQGTYVWPGELANLISVKFEDMEAFIPVGYDTYLKRQYGDYMKLPPLEKRVSTHSDQLRPFVPCDHTEVLHWNERHVPASNKTHLASIGN